MSLNRKSLTLLLAFALTVPAFAANARTVRDTHQIRSREKVSLAITRLLPAAPRPARNFAPVPVNEDQQVVAIWVDRELAWMGEIDRLDEAIAYLSSDRFDPPQSPPWDPRPIDARELCVGVALQADVDENLDGAISVIDCDELDIR